jgi:hypothetical protein
MIAKAIIQAKLEVKKSFPNIFTRSSLGNTVAFGTKSWFCMKIGNCCCLSHSM